jgi:hypothetical protein
MSTKTVKKSDKSLNSKISLKLLDIAKSVGINMFQGPGLEYHINFSLNEQDGTV